MSFDQPYEQEPTEEEMNAYYAGRDAFEGGKPRTSCTIEHEWLRRIWENGWLSGMALAESNEKAKEQG